MTNSLKGSQSTTIPTSGSVSCKGHTKKASHSVIHSVSKEPPSSVEKGHLKTTVSASVSSKDTPSATKEPLSSVVPVIIALPATITSSGEPYPYSPSPEKKKIATLKRSRSNPLIGFSSSNTTSSVPQGPLLSAEECLSKIQ